ncbi:MAG: type II secretion system protein, partial [Acidobacteria bacterium]|nr:type II secretion system protein [Acidobacteriota bacterium]
MGTSPGRHHRVVDGWRRRIADERGFGLLELVIAATVVFGAFTSIAYLGTLAMADVGTARARQSATALANQALEQVRALPRDSIKLGLGNTDLASGDPLITASGTDYRYKGERIPHGDNAPVVPLVPHRVTQVLDGTTYTVAVYVTYLNEAPCQPFLYATASTAPGGITISASPTDPATAVDGASFDRAVLSLPNQSSNLQSEQSSASQSRVTTSGIGYRSASTDNDTMLGLQTAFASADSDPSQVRQDYDEESAARLAVPRPASVRVAAVVATWLVVPVARDWL